MKRFSRRVFVQAALLGGASLAGALSLLRSGSGAMGDIGMSGDAASGPELNSIARDNFAVVYGDPALRAHFLSFLTHVFHLYPEDALHTLIAESLRESQSKVDHSIYERVATHLPEISPPFGAVRYALPALRKQQTVLAQQTMQLLTEKQRVEGYLEIGSNGRYYSALRSRLAIDGPIFTSSPTVPGYGPDEILDRQQLTPVGTHLPMNGYAPLSSRELPTESIELATIYVGLHHVPLALRVPYVESIRVALRPGATLILRDHDVTSQPLAHLVALAHDVFNAGTDQPWSANEHELRNFYPLEFIVGFLEQHGFVAKPGRLLQDGDPTRNTLLAFTKA